jgi:outer membrane protein OmpA-like peptidoglycan-associated protein
MKMSLSVALIHWVSALDHHREEKTMRSWLLAVAFGFAVLTPADVATAEEIPEHALIRPYPGSVLAENMSKYRDFDAHEFPVIDAATGKKSNQTVKGKTWQLLYEVRTDDGSRATNISTLEFIENYKNAALAKGGEVVFEDRGRLVFSIPRDDGGTTWCDVKPQGNMGQQYVKIVDEEGLKQAMTFGPAEMKTALDKDGRILLYGIHFDLDQATLRQDSDKQLQHIVTLLNQNPDLILEVQGHTDDQGDDAHNMALSQRRAEAVLGYLVLFGIDAARLTPAGYGETAPVAPNDTEAGRAKNRRVELVRQ